MTAYYHTYGEPPPSYNKQRSLGRAPSCYKHGPPYNEAPPGIRTGLPCHSGLWGACSGLKRKKGEPWKKKQKSVVKFGLNGMKPKSRKSEKPKNRNIRKKLD